MRHCGYSALTGDSNVARPGLMDHTCTGLCYYATSWVPYCPPHDPRILHLVQQRLAVRVLSRRRDRAPGWCGIPCRRQVHTGEGLQGSYLATHPRTSAAEGLPCMAEVYIDLRCCASASTPVVCATASERLHPGPSPVTYGAWVSCNPDATAYHAQCLVCAPPPPYPIRAGSMPLNVQHTEQAVQQGTR